MTAPSPVNFVVFDLGGVVVRICRSIHEAADRCGWSVPAGELAPEKRAARKAVHALYERGDIACDEFYRRLSATTESRITPEQFRMLHERWIIDEYPGVADVIDDLHAHGIATGVLSNTNVSHWRQLVGDPAAGVAPRFPTPSRAQHVHASHLLRLAKPDRRIYDEFVRRTGADPSRTIFFDDLEDNVRAAREAGWFAHAIDYTGNPGAQIRARLVREGIIPGG